MTVDRDVIRWQTCTDIQLLRFRSLDEIPGFAHAVTTRPWNMAPHRGPDSEDAVDRRRRVCEALDLQFDRLTAPQQIHSGHVISIRDRDVGSGRFGRDGAIRYVDGLVCDRPGVPVIQLSADCALVVAVDPERRAFGTAHASWRGTVAGIAGALVQRMQADAATDPANIRAAICPCAGPHRYEVGEDVARIVRAMLPDADRLLPENASGQLCFYIQAANVDQLVRCGVRTERIAVARICTIEDRRFFSHRRDGPDTGRFALIAGFVE